jgi:hypothetical protein
MDLTNVKKEIKTIKKALKSNEKPGDRALGVFARIDLYKKIYESPEYEEYKEAMQRNDTAKVKQIKSKVPESLLIYFKRCYDFEVKQLFDLMAFVEHGNDENL